MNRHIAFVTTLLMMSICLVHCANQVRKTAPAEIPAENQKIILMAIIDSLQLADLAEWPLDDALKQSMLLRIPRTLDRALAIEFRRCEKLGMFTLVTDTSDLSAMRVRIKLQKSSATPSRLRSDITVTIDIPALAETKTYWFESTGLYRSKTGPQSSFHHLGFLIQDYCRNFPAADIAQLFYPSAK